MVNLKEYNDTSDSLSDLLPYIFAVDDGILILKNGSLMISYEYSGDDPETLSNADKNSIIGNINRSLLRLGTGYAMFQDTMRYNVSEYFDDQIFPCDVAKYIDDKRKNFFLKENHFASKYFINFIYTIPEDNQDKIKKLLIDDEQIMQSFDKHLAEFKKNIESVVDLLSSKLKIKKLSTPEQLSYIHYCITGSYNKSRNFHEFCYLDSVLASEDFVGGFRPKIGKYYLRMLSITGFPDYVYPDDMNFINKLPVSFRWSNRFIFLDEQDAVSEINKIRGAWFYKKETVFSFLVNALKRGKNETVSHKNQDAILHIEDSEKATLEANLGAVKYGFFTSTIILYDENKEKIEKNAQLLVKIFNNNGYYVKIEELNAVDAFLGSLPGGLMYNLRKPMIHTVNLACILPLLSFYTGSKVNPCNLYPENSPSLMVVNSEATTPFYFNLHVNDVGHAVIFGPTGAGKSTLLDLLAVQFLRYPDCQVYYFDKGYSSYIMTRAIGGTHIDILGQSQNITLTPLQYISESKSELTWAAEYISQLVKIQGTPVNAEKENKIYDALDAYSKKGVIATLSDIANHIQDLDIRNALKYYTISGTCGNLLDSTEENLSGSFFTVYEMGNVMNMSEKVLNPVLLYLFHRVEHSLKGKPTLIILDEAWAMLRNDMFKEKIREWLKVTRKLNTAVVFATQSITDVMNSSISDVIMENCPTKILLPNIEAKTENIMPLYLKMGLTEGHVEIISDLIPKKHYFYLSPNGKRIMDLGLDKDTLKFLKSDMESIAAAREIKEDFYNVWKNN